MKVEFENLLRDFSGNHPVAKNVLNSIEIKLGKSLPDDYKELLEFSNGGEGNLGKEYLIIWAVEELIEFNQQYEVDKYAPGLLVFGSNGGGEAYAFDYRSGRFSGIVKIPFVGMDPKHVKPLSLTFIEFLKKLNSE